jgi:hypothetical protein
MGGDGTPAEPSRRRIWRRAGWVFVVAVVGCSAVLLAWFVRDRWLPARQYGSLYRDLEAKLTEAETVWMRLDDLWGRLEDGQMALCSEEQVARPYFLAWRKVDRDAYMELAILADDLNAAIRGLHGAADAWVAVCQSGQSGIAPDTAAEARAALTRAATILSELSAIVPLLQE